MSDHAGAKVRLLTEEKLRLDEDAAIRCDLGVNASDVVEYVAIARWATLMEAWALQHSEELIAHGSVTSLRELDALLAQIESPTTETK